MLSYRTRSSSTPRLALTRVYFVVLMLLAAVAGAPAPRSAYLAQMFEIASLALVVLTVLGRVWCSAFIAGRKEAELVTEGPYAACRHPLYALSILGGLGLGLATQSFTLSLLTVVVLAVLLARAANAEERALAARHGEDFVRYARATPKWWPRRVDLHPDRMLTVRAPLYWKAFLDAWSFVLLYIVIDTGRALRQADMLPTLIALP